jgi:hypothetical protein
VRSGEQEQTVANNGKGQKQCLQRFNQSLQRNQAWSGRQESNSRSQLGNLRILWSDGEQKFGSDWRNRWLRIAALEAGLKIGATNDVSYCVYIYAFPVGQLLATAGLQKAGYLTFMLATIVCTIPLAAASWWGLEKWALKARTWQPFSRSKVVLINWRQSSREVWILTS